MSQLEVRFTIKGQTQETTFTPIQERDGTFYLQSENGIKIPIILKENIFSIEKSSPIDFDEVDDIVEERLLGLSEAWLDATAQGFEASGATGTSSTKPGYGPDDIFVENKPFSIKQIYDLINDGDIEMSPNFQRNFIWDKTRQSRLIESIFLGLPLPSIYLSQYDDGRLTIVDGLQRLNTIKKFMDDKLALCNMEYLSDCNGKCYSQLPKILSSLQIRKFKQTQIMCFVIDYRSPNSLKYDLFRRLNTGGKPLNNQEIRNCLSKPALQNTLAEMTSSQAFKQATGGSVKDNRMDAHEAALRFIYFFDQYSEKNPTGNYNGAMDTTLDSYVDELNTRENLSEYVSLYSNSMETAYDLFGQYAFRKVSKGYAHRRTNPVNKLLLLAISVLLARHNDKYDISKAKVHNLTRRLAKLLDTDSKLFELITTSTNAKANISQVMTILKTQLFDPNFI